VTRESIEHFAGSDAMNPGLFIEHECSRLLPAMDAVGLETILLPEDITDRVSLHCLACRQRLGSVSYIERPLSDGTTQTAVSVSLQADLLKDFRQATERVILVCGCGQTSTYHLL